MKKILIVFAVAMLGLLTWGNAQKPFAGTIKKHSFIEGTDDPNILAQGESESSVTLFGNYTKTVITPQEGFGIITITNGDAKTVTMILDIMGMGKYYSEVPADKIAERLKNTKYEYKKTGEKKTIAGYECDKVNVTATDLETDESSEVVVYISTAINPNPEINFVELPGLAGFPLRIEQKTSVDGTDVTVVDEALEVIPNKKIKVVDFMLPADAQDIKSNPELMKMLGMGDEEDEED